MAFGSMICCGKRSIRKSKGAKLLTWRKFSLKELHSATNNFNYDNKLGEGTFGSVYWGQLWDGSQIAVKRLKVWSDEAETEFSDAIEQLGRIRHKDLLSLRGYCCEGQERLIVYEYMPNLSLLSHLRGQSSSECLLDWTRRMKIAIGSAEGIAYLHTQATPRIIHGDVKASNILLDSDFHAKVSDFGFAKFIPHSAATNATTEAKGKLGYVAPEHDVPENAKESSDVFGFGILLLELASGRRPLELVAWALPLARQRKFDEIEDPKLNGKVVENEMRRVVITGIACAHKLPEKRPKMTEVVALLKGEAKEKLTELERELSKIDDDHHHHQHGDDEMAATKGSDLKPEQEIVDSDSGDNLSHGHRSYLSEPLKISPAATFLQKDSSFADASTTVTLAHPPPQRPPIHRIMALISRSGFIWLAIATAFLAILIRFAPSGCPFPHSPSTASTSAPGNRLFTAEELSLYNGTDESLPILLGILGSVFDVTKGRSHYGPGGSYSQFAGRDASRAFVSGDFTPGGLNDSLAGLPAGEVKSIVEWRGFYFRTYIPVGKLIGRYYDAEGKPTKHVRAAEAKAKKGKQLEEKVAQEEGKIPSCNSRWSQDEGGEVWCDAGSDGGSFYPRLVARPESIALTGKMSKRCACMERERLEEPGSEVYQGCDFLATRCKV
ncbi:hypothetical protein V2J09_023544 [Rumex salicifolius]